MKRRFHPGMADNRARDNALMKQTEQRAAFITARIDSHGADGLAAWLDSNNVIGWGSHDVGEALGLIRKRLGDAAWRQALEVIG